MSRMDEARYGKACLLVLNVCVFSLRHVIDNYSIQHGSLSIVDFLEKNKHSLFHLYSTRCCCRNQQSRATPMYKTQWETLFMKNMSSCSRGMNDCPCQYIARSGITTNVMDITMCCLVINNICPGVNVADVNIIREIRNKLIHAASGHLDHITFNDYWNKVKTALLNLASHVSPIVLTDTSSMIDELQNRVMDPYELGELRKLVMDEKRINDLEVSVKNLTVSEGQTRNQLAYITTDVKRLQIQYVSETTDKLKRIEDRMTQNINQTRRKISRLEMTVDNSEQIIDDHGKRIDDHDRQFQTQERLLQSHQNAILDMKQKIDTGESTWKLPKFLMSLFNRDVMGVENLRHTLTNINNNLTKSVQISPLQERGEDELPIKLLFASVVILEDHKYDEKGRASSKQNREVTDLADIFEKDGKEVRQIYMLGDTAHGKTTYCLWLLQNWCNIRNRDMIKSENLQNCEKAMKRFDFVFLVRLCNVDSNLDSVIDMICDDLFRDDTDCHAAARHVLSTDKYKSLIIIDGLDEWKPNEETKRKLTFQGMPNIRVSSTVSCFISMRPWMFALITKMVKIDAKVIEILGLSEAGMKNVIRNVLLHHFALRNNKSKYTQKFNKILQNLKDKTLKSFMQIPLLAVVCVQMWYGGKQVGDSLTSFYAEMLNMLIERATEKHRLHVQQDKVISSELPQILSAYEKIENCMSVLLNLGKVAYEVLISSERNFVFQKSKFENRIGAKELQFALDVGLISQKDARSLTTKNVSVHFFHQSIQEFLAGIYIVTNEEVSDSFCKHLSNVNVIMELSNVIKFICGLCPSIGSVVSQHVVSVIDSDKKVSEYRESPGLGNSRVKELYTLQLSWYREILYGQKDISVTFYVSDIYLRCHSDIEAVRLTRELLSDSHVNIRSLWLWLVPTEAEIGITNKQLNAFLSNSHYTRSLVMVRIDGEGTNRTLHSICIPTLRYLYLNDLKVNSTYRDGNIRSPLLTDMTSLREFELVRVTFGERGLDLSNLTSLRELRLVGVNLGDRGLDLSAYMVHITLVWLEVVTMSSARWQQFILSVLSIHHGLNVILDDTNIDYGSMTMIRSSPDFIVRRDDEDVNGGYQFYFTRAWPLAKITRNDNDVNEILYTRV